MQRVLFLLTCALALGCGAAPTERPASPTKPLGTPIAKVDKNKDMPFGPAPPPGKSVPVKPVPAQSSKFEAQVRSIDTRNNTLTLAVGGQDRTLPLGPDAFICDDSSRNLGIPGGLQGLQVGSSVSVVTSKVGQLETIALVIVRTRGQ